MKLESFVIKSKIYNYNITDKIEETYRKTLKLKIIMSNNAHKMVDLQNITKLIKRDITNIFW